MRGPGRATAVAILASLVVPLNVVAQSPGPSVSASPSPFTLATRGQAADDRFRLTIETGDPQVATDDIINIRTTWRYLGSEPIRICTGGGGPVIFVVEQLDGPFDPGGEPDAGGQMMTITPGTVDEVPFQKSGGYDLSDPIAAQVAAWFDDPELHLPAGVFRITAHAHYAIDDCAPGAELDASVVIKVAETPAASPSPSSPGAMAPSWASPMPGSATSP
jgi:hypothetical protein